MTLLDSMKRCVARSIDAVDGVSVWYANSTSDLDLLRSFSEWCHATYH